MSAFYDERVRLAKARVCDKQDECVPNESDKIALRTGVGGSGLRLGRRESW